MAYSKLLHKYYDAKNSSSIYLKNINQICYLLINGCEEFLVDILYYDLKPDELIFVFKNTNLVNELLDKYKQGGE